MYMQQIIHYPAAGKGLELRQACEARTNAGNATGSPHSLAARMFAEEPALIAQIRHESLAAMQAYQEKNATDEAYQTQTRRILECVARPMPQQLWEVLVPAQPAEPPGYAQRVVYFPAPGKGPELRRLLEERMAKKPPGVLGAALGLRVAPPDGAQFGVTILFANLGGMDEFRAAQASDPTFQPWIAQVGAATSRPAQQEMLRVLQPFPMP